MPEVKVTVKEANKEKDIFYAGNLVKAEDGTVLLVTDKTAFGDCFSGVLIFKGRKESRLLGHCYNNWDKSAFVQFEGEITITV